MASYDRPDGMMTVFDAPDAGVGRSQGTFAWSINAKGEITGYYLDNNSNYHAFLRTSDGSMSSFDAPGAGVGPFQGTLAKSINTKGEITGYYFDSNYKSHGFVSQSSSDECGGKNCENGSRD